MKNSFKAGAAVFSAEHLHSHVTKDPPSQFLDTKPVGIINAPNGIGLNTFLKPYSCKGENSCSTFLAIHTL